MYAVLLGVLFSFSTCPRHQRCNASYRHERNLHATRLQEGRDIKRRIFTKEQSYHYHQGCLENHRLLHPDNRSCNTPPLYQASQREWIIEFKKGPPLESSSASSSSSESEAES